MQKIIWRKSLLVQLGLVKENFGGWKLSSGRVGWFDGSMGGLGGWCKISKDQAVASKVDLSGSNTWVFLFLFVFLFFFFFVFTFCKVALSGSNSESFSLTPHWWRAHCLCLAGGQARPCETNTEPTNVDLLAACNIWSDIWRGGELWVAAKN